VSWSLDASLPFSILKTYLDLQILKFSSFLDPTLNLQKPDHSEPETGLSKIFSLDKFGHQQRLHPMPPSVDPPFEFDLRFEWVGGRDDQGWLV
jgi:hypothetical protein